MSIADKLITIAENEPKVFKAGQLAMLKDSQYMNGKESGTIVSVNDVTPIEHNVGVKLSSDTITDFTGVEVARYERNLFNPIYSNYMQNRFYSYRYVGNAIMRMSFTDKDTTVDVNGIQVGFMADINNVQGGANWAVKSGVIQTNNSNVSASDNSTLCPYIVIYPNTEDVFNRITARYDIQVEVGTVTEYKPYKEPTIYTANADGTVEGVKSISPNMTLIPNNNAVTVECEYLRDIDLYIDNLLKSVAMIGGE